MAWVFDETTSCRSCAPDSARAAWAIYQIGLAKGIAFCLGWGNFMYINEYKSNLFFYNVLGRLVAQCFASIRMPN
jgi:hypothetical protein